MRKVKIVEVGPRDGLQNISKTVPTDVKVKLIKDLARAGFSTVEATSFVPKKWIPQLADSEAVMKEILPLIQAGSTNFPVLVPNTRGFDNAVKNGAREVAVVVSATEGFSQKNLNCSVATGLDRAVAVVKKATANGIRVRGYVSCIFACPYDGPTAPEQVLPIVKDLIDAGCYEISLGDTIGVGTPADVERLLRLLLSIVPADRLAGHFHDTYGQAVANVLKSYEMGLRTFDSSVAGLGGCPFAKGAKGNLASEDIIYALEKMGIPTGVDLEQLARIGAWISKVLDIPNGSRAGAALIAKQEDGRSGKRHSESEAWNEVKSTGQYSMLRRGKNVKIVLTRPKNGNALTLAMINDLTQIFREISVDPRTHHVVLTGQGKFFCTGMDLRGQLATPEQQHDALLGLFEAIDQCPKITVAAINGSCFGGGNGLSFVCDVRLATAASAFTLSEAKLGLTPATISKYIIREWGVGFARTAMLTARAVSAAELHKLGAIEVVAKDISDLDSELEKLLNTLRFVAPNAASLCKELVRQGFEDPGGAVQAATIKSAFTKMMADGSESRHGMEQFRKGVKQVDWESELEGSIKSKL